MEPFSRLLDIPPTMSDDVRRGRILNIILLGCVLLFIISLISTIFFHRTGSITTTEANTIYLDGLIFTVSMGLIYLINRAGAHKQAAILFVAVLTLVIFFSDTPYQITWTGNIVAFTLPILIASVILHPVASFPVAGSITLIFYLAAYYESFSPNFYGGIALFGLALVAWISAQILEQAIKKLRYVNHELDERVAQRTTELQRAETELRKALGKEKELNQLKSNFISMTSHEFRTPLTTILSSTELLEYANGTMSPDRRLNHYGKVRTAVNQMTRLLDDILFISKTENGHLEFAPEAMDIEQLCRDIIEEMHLITKKTHLIDFSSHFTSGNAFLDPRLMRQIITNLLSNAIKYSPAQSTITFTLAEQNQQLILTVQDKGIGIPQADQTHLFDSFYRASNVRHISGTGLGLTIVQRAVTLQGGQVQFHSKEGLGTEFVVTIPLPKPGATA